MERLKWFIARARRWEYTFLCLLVVINLAVHFSIISDTHDFILDEVHYVPDAKVILEEHTTAHTEHPPLGKLLVAAGIALLGDNPFGWRTLPVLFGTANIVLLYLICRRLRMSRKAANIAAFLLTFENLSFIQGGIAMLDVFSLAFMMLSFWLYLRRNYPLSGVAVALATLVKLTGAFALIVIFLHWIFVRRERLFRFLGSMALAPIGFVALMPALNFIIFHRMMDTILLIRVMLSQSAHLTFANTTHPYVILPWNLPIIPRVLPYHYDPHYFGAISFTIWALMIPVFIYMTVMAIKKSEAGAFGLAWFAGTYLVWIPAVLITDRVVHVYYFYPMIGALSLGLGMGLSQLVDFWEKTPKGKPGVAAISAVVAFLVLHLAVFYSLAPVNPWAVERLLIPLI